jgi:hypothetical protein
MNPQRKSYDPRGQLEGPWVNKTYKLFSVHAILALSFGRAPSGGIYMQFERGKPPEIPNAPYRAARVKDERWRSAVSGFEPGQAGPRLSLRSSQDQRVVRRDQVGLPGALLSCEKLCQLTSRRPRDMASGKLRELLSTLHRLLAL